MEARKPSELEDGAGREYGINGAGAAFWGAATSGEAEILCGWEMLSGRAG
jgi:hypothetical protein